ncbi:MAG TPA: VOC family protein [Pyrinomonadaceae bacterium]|nr:VOC family protein [Pyrinomonadaceae bacterium]
MAVGTIKLHHVNVTVPAALEEAAKSFYGNVLGLKQIEKPDGPRKYVGAWYQIGKSQLHLSIEKEPRNQDSNRHVCYSVLDVARALETVRAGGIEVVSEKQLVNGGSRFFVRDPAGNLIEITEETSP